MSFEVKDLYIRAGRYPRFCYIHMSSLTNIFTDMLSATKKRHDII